MNRFWGHLSTITRHKIQVGKLCFKVGLYRQGLTHDLSKYSFIEFWNGVKYYQGFRSPIDREKEDRGYSLGWLHHKGRNKHHWEYWIDWDTDKQLVGMAIPEKYLAEMFCDRVAASMIYQKEKYTDCSALEYYLNGKDHIIMNNKTRATLEFWLTHLKDHGLDETCDLIKKQIHHQGN